MATREIIDSKTLNRRTFILAGTGISISAMLAARLYYLQVIRAEDYRLLSEKNRFKYNITMPSRGRIFDRYGEGLAVNRRNFRALLIAEQCPDVEKTLDDFSQIIPLSPARRARILKDISDTPGFVPVLIDEHLAWQSFATLNLKIPDLAGVIPEVGEAREYPNKGAFVHVLGYVGRPTAEDLNKDSDMLLHQPTFRIGKSGIEAQSDRYLRGKSGRLKVEVNATGRIVREWPDVTSKAVSGRDIYLTLDGHLQRHGEALFGEQSGGAVVMDVLTGELRTLLSMPGFDPNLFISGLTNVQLQTLNEDEKLPQFNKVMGGSYPPASTFKIIAALAALAEESMDPLKPFLCEGKFVLGNQTFHCWKAEGHGEVTMREAIKQSCDCYFYNLILNLGMPPVKQMAQLFGLGEVFDFGLEGQARGIIPDKVWKRQRNGESWVRGDSLNAVIGQGFVLVNPLQLAVMTARLANGENAVVPHLFIGENFTSPAPLKINKTHLKFVQDAMRAVCEEPHGTAYRPTGFGIKGVQWAGKTGTGQVRRISEEEREAGIIGNENLPWRLRDHSVFLGFAPFIQPRFAAAVIVEHGGKGSGPAAKIVHGLLKEAVLRDQLAFTHALEEKL